MYFIRLSIDNEHVANQKLSSTAESKLFDVKYSITYTNEQLISTFFPLSWSRWSCNEAQDKIFCDYECYTVIPLNNWPTEIDK